MSLKEIRNIVIAHLANTQSGWEKKQQQHTKQSGS